MGLKKLIWIWVAALLGAPGLSLAKVSGPCVDCHTMHNSQGGVSMSYLDSGETPFSSPNVIVGDDVAPNQALVRYGCVGCHTGTNSLGGAVPFVFGPLTAEYGTNTLAGGDFRWVFDGLDGSTKGHNVIDLPGVPSDMAAPGGAMGAGLLTCAGLNGCHGDGSDDQFVSIAGGHHGSGGSTLLTDTTKIYTSGSTADMSDAFRMLSGIKGIEDDDWEYTANGTKISADHNLYSGAHRSNENLITGTISALCAKCHGDFHNGTGSIGIGSAWLRHPIDFDMSTLAVSSEYDGYDAYSMEAPVAVSSMSSATDLTAIDHLGGRGAANGNAIVMCLSCHRAHGSPYGGILRWDYKNWPGTGTNGCAICHTTKN